MCYQSAVSETIFTVRSLPSYQLVRVTGLLTVAEPSATPPRGWASPRPLGEVVPSLARLARRGRLVESGVQLKAGYEGYGIREPPGQRSKSFKEAYPQRRRGPRSLAFGIPAPPEHNQQLPSPLLLGYLLVPLAPLSGIERSEGARALKNGKAHTLQRPPRDRREQSIRHTPISLRPLVFTKWPWGCGARRVPVDALGAAMFFPRRLSRVSSTPKTTSGPSGTKVSTSNPNRMRLASRLDQLGRLRSRW